MKSDVEGKIAALRKTMEGDDAAAIKAATEELAKASHKLAEQLYQQQAPNGGASSPVPGANPRRRCRPGQQQRRRGGRRLHRSEEIIPIPYASQGRPFGAVPFLCPRPLLFLGRGCYPGGNQECLCVRIPLLSGSCMSWP